MFELQAGARGRLPCTVKAVRVTAAEHLESAGARDLRVQEDRLGPDVAYRRGVPRVVWVPLSIAVTLGGCGSRSEASMATALMAGPRPIGGGPNSGSPDTGSWAFVTAGEAHTCAISRQGRLACWGLNAEQQIGVHCDEINPNTSAPICTRPRWVPGVGAVRYAACGGIP